MKALVFHDVGDIRLDDVEAPKIQEPTDAIIRLTSSAICGTDLHMIWVRIKAHALFAGQKRLSTPANRGAWFAILHYRRRRLSPPLAIYQTVSLGRSVNKERRFSFTG
jgi:hypothetical protein